MAHTIKIKRGMKSTMPSEAGAGEPLFTMDTKELFIGGGSGQPLSPVGGTKVGVSGTQDYLSSDYFEQDSTNHIRIKQNSTLSGVDVEKLGGHAAGYFSPTTHDHSGTYEPVLTKGNISETTSSVLTITGGTNSVIGSGVTVRVKQAAGSQSGYLSSTDWSAFNGKQDALGYTPVPNTRTVNGNALTGDVVLDYTDVGAEPTLTKGNISETTSSVLTITGGTSSVIGSGVTVQVKQASSTQSGYLSSTDWSTFNGKQDALGYTPENIANRGIAFGYATLDISSKLSQNIDASKITSGTIDIARIPPAAIERLVIVADQAARYALTTATIQNGDTVKEQDTGNMYYVMDDANLGNANGYAQYTAGTASAVDWSGVLNTPTDLSGYGILDAVPNSDVATTATAGKILKLDSNAKLPADITGDAGTLDGHDSTYFSPTTHDHTGTYEPVVTKGNLSESTSSVLTITGGTGSVIGSGTSVRVKQSSSTQDGYLSSADWTAFDSKQSALGYTPVPNTRTVNGNALSADVVLDYTDVGAEPTLTKGNISETTSSVLTITGGTNSVIGSGVAVRVNQSSSTQDGYLSSTDWSTFNSKQSALGYTPVPNTRTVNGNALDADVVLDYTDVGAEPTLTKGNISETTSSVLTITGGTSSVIGSGVTVQVNQASSTQSGYLSNTDWSAFDGKLDSSDTATDSTASTIAMRDASGNLTSKAFVSDVVTGTAPMTVASTTKVTNLNADSVDSCGVNDSGVNTSALWTASKIISYVGALKFRTF